MQLLKSPLFYIALAGVISAVGLVRRMQASIKTEAPPPLAQPARAPFRKGVGGSGLVEADGENVRIAAPQSGLITEVMARVGDRVATGTSLLQMDNRQAAADARVQESQIEVLEARVKEAESQVADRRDQYDRTSPLTQKEVLSVNETKRNFYALRTAEAALTRAKAELSQARTTLERVRVTLDVLTVKAPRAGKVLQVNVRAGEFANQMSSDALMLLGETDSLQVRADIDEQNASRVRRESPATAYVKGAADKPVPLEFVRIEPYILPKRSLTGLSTERVDTRVLQVIYRFRPTKEFPVYVGQQMDVYVDDAATATPDPGGDRARPAPAMALDTADSASTSPTGRQ